MHCHATVTRLGARPCARQGLLSGYLGRSSNDFEVAMGKFAAAYADQAERDHAVLKAAVRKGKIAVYQES
jgi:hypothetical protein